MTLEPERLPETSYRDHKAISQSDLKLIKSKSLSHYKNRVPRKDTPALKLGRAIHMAVFEPERFNETYVKIPSDLNRRTKKGRETFALLTEGREPITDEDSTTCERIRDKLRYHPEASELINGCEFEKQVYAYDEKTGLNIKGMLDGYKPGLIVDLKTTLNAEPGAFTKDIFKHGYHFQAAFYIDLIQRVLGEYPSYKIIAVEKYFPYALSIFELSEKTIAIGRQDYKVQLSRLALAIKNNDFPSYPKLTTVRPPAWLESEWFKNA